MIEMVISTLFLFQGNCKDVCVMKTYKLYDNNN